MVSIEPTLSTTAVSTATITTTVFGTAPIETLTPVDCPQDKSTVVGASVGAVLGGTLIATLLVLLSVLRRRSDKSPHTTLPKMTSVTSRQAGPETGWRTEMECPPEGPGARKPISTTYEIDGRQANILEM